ncbi:MAG TPA: O-antigen ligase family protein [Gaiellaceae bacterium]|nr:O-antigen ligase family protein [Gaiellaceae bacterium]
MTERLPRLALAAFVVGLALHNLALSVLWDWGVRGTVLDVVAAWKEALLALALGIVLWRSRRLPLATLADRLALAYAAVVVVYAVLPQSWLGGEATTRGVLLGLRHALLPVAAYGLGRLLSLTWPQTRRLLDLAIATAVAVALIGLVDAYLVPLQWWRDSGVPGWYREQLGLDYVGLSGLPENWAYNTGDEQNPIRRLVSTFLSPLASAYLLVVVLLLLAARPRRPWVLAAAAVAYVGLLFTHTRAAYLALAGGLVVLALVTRRWWPVAAAAASIAVGLAFVSVYDQVGPSTSYTPQELEQLRRNAAEHPGASSDPLSGDEASTASHLRNLRDGLETVFRHPQGYGLGNAGTVARRTGIAPKAGESTYTELGVETGVAGMLLFVAWSLAVLAALWQRTAWLTAAFAAVLALALQTDVLGVHWLAYCVWAAAGIALQLPAGRGDATVEAAAPAPRRPARAAPAGSRAPGTSGS